MNTVRFPSDILKWNRVISVYSGSGFAGTIDTLCELEPDANVMDNGLAISRNDVADASIVVTDWIQSLQ